MKVFKCLAQWQQFRDELLVDSLGFVPTMGSLHQGHLSLVKASQQHCSQTLVSIFVNPQQFDNKADLEAYPVTIQQDLSQLENAGVDMLLMPDAEQMYTDNYRFKVTEGQSISTEAASAQVDLPVGRPTLGSIIKYSPVAA